MSRAADYLRGLIDEEGGSISVERFMREALYHPEFGYYARKVRTVGARGDFSTSATLHPALGLAIARWLAAHGDGGIISRRAAETQSGEENRSLPQFAFHPSAALRLCVRLFRRMFGVRWHVIELGAGTGELAASVLAGLGRWGRRGLRYHIVEVSEGLRATQQTRLANPVRWHDDMADALRVTNGHALIFSNEFVDAFPVEQMAWHEAAQSWREVRVRSTQNGCESFVPEVPNGAPTSQRIERRHSYRRWLKSWAPQWRAGRMLTIDYGDLWPHGYERRPNGTLRAYWHHQRLEGSEFFARFGQQDLTSDVNFSELEEWGAEVEWGSDPLLNQTHFLRRWLPPKTLANSDPALAFLLDPHGAGGAFKTIEQWPAGSVGASGVVGVPSSSI